MLKSLKNKGFEFLSKIIHNLGCQNQFDIVGCFRCPKPTPKTMKLKQALMNGQDLSPTEAAEVIHEMRRRVYEDGADPEEVLYEEGLEPDYIFDLI
jgi:hypothetical protein